MKKLGLLVAAATMALSVSAQTVKESQTLDNIYIGVNGGLATKTTHNAWMKGLNSNFGVRVGRNFTPVFGLAIESNAYFSNKPWTSTGTSVRFLNTGLLGTINFSNWFGGYQGEPRLFEVSGVAGLGWGHLFGNTAEYKKLTRTNNLTSKLGLDFAFNLGSAKAWQLYVEPAMVYGMNDVSEAPYHMANGSVQYNINHSFFQLNAGIVYKFKNSNDSHNFVLANEGRDQSEIDALNDQINNLRQELAQKPKEVVKTVVKEAPAPEVVKVENLVFVTFAQGKSTLTKDATKALDAIQSGKHVQIVGTASPEGPKDLNEKLSQNRADAVAKYLQSKGVIVDEATGKGVQGNTSNRLAVVYVK